jgi:ADP-ribose pyrophosphatase YjhB (NUDIX family)
MQNTYFCTNNNYFYINIYIASNMDKINPFVSVDCVLLGFNGSQLCVLLVKQKSANQSGNYNIYKLPGSLIDMDEDLDDAAHRVLHELTGLKSVEMHQFHAFGAIDRMSNPKDVLWLERFHNLNVPIERVVTIGYLSLLRLDRRLSELNQSYEACWLPINEIGTLAFDHNKLIHYALETIRHMAEITPEALFSLLPRKFTAAQLRCLFEVINGNPIDVRNFHKKMQSFKYIVPLNEYESNVSHRAAQYFKFDKVAYNRAHF